MSRRTPRDRDERGAVLVFIAAMAVVLMMIGALAVDLGMQRVARRDMQALADVVSLDLARQLDGRTAGEIGSLQVLAEISRDRNAGTIGTGVPQVTPVLGTIDARGAFTPLSSPTQVPTAVRVRTRTAVNFAFRAGVGAADRAAVATAASSACFSVGSYAARLNAGESSLVTALNSVLGGSVDAVSYQGLGSAQVSLADLAAELSAIRPDDIVNIRQIRVKDFYLALANALTREGATAQAHLLNQTIGQHVPGNLRFDIDRILSVGQGSGSALDARLNVLDLVTAAAFAATGTNGATVPTLATSIPGFVTTSATAKVVEAPRIGCGAVGTRARTSQVGVYLTGVATPQFTVSSYTLSNIRADVKLALDVAPGSATLAMISCEPQSVELLTASGLVTPNLETVVSFVTSVSGPAGLPISITVKVPVTMTAERPPVAGRARIDMPPYDRAVTSSPRGSLLSGGSPSPVVGDPVATVTLTGTPYLLTADTKSLFRGAVSGYVMTRLLPDLDAGITTAVRNTLGMDLAGIDVFGHQQPNCNSPELVSGPND
ncbi:pilus assembly protein TadG-related protein [Nocardioides sp.]|uniref:pilus assembly protein TadG-related protein n=1 Tax=Nocardioides sp. TaxID=35761 RepID=UPI003569CE0D